MPGVQATTQTMTTTDPSGSGEGDIKHTHVLKYCHFEILYCSGQKYLSLVILILTNRFICMYGYLLQSTDPLKKQRVVKIKTTLKVIQLFNYKLLMYVHLVYRFVNRIFADVLLILFMTTDQKLHHNESK